MLEHVGAHRSVYPVKQVLWVGPNLLMMVVFLWGYAHYGLVLFASLVSVAVALWQLGADMALGKATTCAEGEHQLAPA